jgi:hypothetical protein
MVLNQFKKKRILQHLKMRAEDIRAFPGSAVLDQALHLRFAARGRVEKSPPTPLPLPPGRAFVSV